MSDNGQTLGWYLLQVLRLCLYGTILVLALCIIGWDLKDPANSERGCEGAVGSKRANNSISISQGDITSKNSNKGIYLNNNISSNIPNYNSENFSFTQNKYSYIKAYAAEGGEIFTALITNFFLKLTWKGYICLLFTWIGFIGFKDAAHNLFVRKKG